MYNINNIDDFIDNIKNENFIHMLPFCINNEIKNNNLSIFIKKIKKIKKNNIKTYNIKIKSNNYYIDNCPYNEKYNMNILL
jgi:hypothetical protein